MARVNVAKKEHIYTHGGARAVPISAVKQLERSVMSCLLWEKEFYESGEDIASRIKELCSLVSPKEVARIAIEAKNEMHLRHVPLFLTRELCRTKEGRELLKDVIPKVILRVDDISEFLAMYWQEGKIPLAKQVKKHLGEAFRKFDEHRLAKYNGGSKAVKLRDVMKLCRPKPVDAQQAELWRKLIKNELTTPDTWEVAISATKNKKAEWSRLLQENKLGGLAMLRNIRNMTKADVPKELIREGTKNLNTHKLLPINFVAAARHNPGYEDVIEEKLLQCMADKPKLKGKTILVVDTSGSMGGNLSSRSELTRRDVAGGLAIIAREMCEEVVIYCTAGSDGARKAATMQIPARRGFALSEYINGNEVRREIGSGGIFLVQCMDYISRQEKSADRIIVITDEQDCDNDKNPESANTFGINNYLINIASAKNGIGYRKWTHIDGWSDRVLTYISNIENLSSVN